MATITVRGLDDLLHARLKVRAAENGRSMEEEARMIRRHALEPRPDNAIRTGSDFVAAMRGIAAEFGYWDDIDFDAIRRESRPFPGRDVDLDWMSDWSEDVTDLREHGRRSADDEDAS